MSETSRLRKVQTSQSGIDYVPKELKRKKGVVTRAFFWRIPHHSGKIEICLKVGRYKTAHGGETIETELPKSELTLDEEELNALIGYLEENLEPLKNGASQYILMNGQISSETAKQLRTFFNKPEKDEILEIIVQHEMLPADLLHGLQQRERKKALEEFEQLLAQNAVEQEWQKWFSSNAWVLGSEFVRIISDRKIDTENVADFLVQAYDGFLDIIEIKRPETGQEFWANKQYRGNYIPSTELVGTIMQATNYVYEVEREANSNKFLERMDSVKAIKPRGVLIYGRSNKWNNKQAEAFRLLNASYHNLTIMTYDHVLQRAKRMLGYKLPLPPPVDDDDDIPF